MENLNIILEVRSSHDEDFRIFQQLCESDDNWTLHSNKSVRVESRTFPGSTVAAIRAKSRILNVSPLTLFDAISDQSYREEWDTNMNEYYHICQLDKYNCLSYYCMNCPFPLKNRDIVIQSTWRQIGDSYVVVQHSVDLDSLLTKPDVVRTTLYLAGFSIVPIEGGCYFTYINQCDPYTIIPQFIWNAITTLITPSIVNKMASAALKYPAWKQANNSNYHPWRDPSHRCISDYAKLEDLHRWGFNTNVEVEVEINSFILKQKIDDDDDDDIASGSDAASFHSANEDDVHIDSLNQSDHQIEKFIQSDFK